jgi:transcription termination factor Rho
VTTTETTATTRRRTAGTRPRNRQAPARPPAGAPAADTPVTGLVDIVGDKAWIRADGYLPGPADVPVPARQVQRLGLRRGDHITGTVHPSQPLSVTTVNGKDPQARRAGFAELTAVHPHERLRLGASDDLTARVTDLVMPLGKGQRALIVAPPKAGKTMVLTSIANAIAAAHPECHLMMLLVDERPEEVTDLRRTVRGEVVAATFDRPPAEHTAVAELAIERAKRLVEDGRDVVVLLDSLTRLGRAYNLLSSGRGRTLTGGLDSTALYPPKRLLGAARAIEGGGSLTIIATALVDTGSALDAVIFEELKGTGNAELRLDRGLAEARVFPAVDITTSGTRHDELLSGPAELAVVHRLRRALAGQERRPALQRLLAQLTGTPSNADFLRQVAAALPG